MIWKDPLARLNPYIRNKRYIVEFAFQVMWNAMIWNDSRTRLNPYIRNMMHQTVRTTNKINNTSTPPNLKSQQQKKTFEFLTFLNSKLSKSNSGGTPPLWRPRAPFVICLRTYVFVHIFEVWIIWRWLARFVRIQKLNNVPFISYVRIETGQWVLSNHCISQYQNNTYLIFPRGGLRHDLKSYVS